MSEDAAERMLSTVAGHEVQLNHVSRQLHDIVRRPLFALIYASLGARAADAKSPALLLALLVEKVLERDRAASTQLFTLLQTLAIRTMTHRGVLPKSEAGRLDLVEKLLETRLVVVRDGSVRFAAPVIEQYFAAQALLNGDVDATGQVASLRTWELWRPAWVMAVAIGAWEDSSRLITSLLGAHPGAAAWLVHQALPTSGTPKITVATSSMCTYWSAVFS